MLIVVEGPDATGKTTLAKKIAKVLHAKYMHHKRPPKDAYTYFRRALKEARTKNVVCDRWIFGSPIYANVLGHEHRLSRMDYDALLKEAIELGLVLIHCTDTPRRIRDRFKKTGEKFLPANKVEAIVKEFHNLTDEFYQQRKFPVIVMNNFTRKLFASTPGYWIL